MMIAPPVPPEALLLVKLQFVTVLGLSEYAKKIAPPLVAVLLVKLQFFTSPVSKK